MSEADQALPAFCECPHCGHGNDPMRPTEAGRCLWVRCDRCGKGFRPLEAESEA